MSCHSVVIGVLFELWTVRCPGNGDIINTGRLDDQNSMIIAVGQLSAGMTSYNERINTVGVPTLAKIKPQYILAHLQAMAEPTDPQELAISLTSSSLLRYPQDADSSAVDLWVIDAKIHWETCTQNWRLAKVTSLEWPSVQYASRHCSNVANAVKTGGTEGNDSTFCSSSLCRLVLVQQLRLSSHRYNQRLRGPVLRSFSPALTATTPSFVLPPREPLPVKPRPIFKRKTTVTSDESATTGASFELDVTSPLHPNLSALLKTGPPKGVTPSEGSTRSSQRLQVVNAASRRQVLPGPNPITEDDEDEVTTPGATEKETEVIPGTDKDEDDFQVPEAPSTFIDVDEEEYNSPPPTNIAWRCRSPVPPVTSGPPPITVSELLGAPVSKPPKKGSQKKSKLDNPTPASNDSAAEGTVKAA
ncbi:hypothetical protein EDD18DRAFT_1109996, partial [Armillaria luteobubalina]